MTRLRYPSSLPSLCPKPNFPSDSRILVVAFETEQRAIRSSCFYSPQRSLTDTTSECIQCVSTPHLSQGAWQPPPQIAAGAAAMVMRTEILGSRPNSKPPRAAVQSRNRPARQWREARPLARSQQQAPWHGSCDRNLLSRADKPNSITQAQFDHLRHRKETCRLDLHGLQPIHPEHADCAHAAHAHDSRSGPWCHPLRIAC